MGCACSGSGRRADWSLSLQSSLSAKMSIGVPIKVLHEAEGHIVTCETNTGEVYRGKLIEAEDNMNCQVGRPLRSEHRGPLDAVPRGSGVLRPPVCQGPEPNGILEALALCFVFFAPSWFPPKVWGPA